MSELEEEPLAEKEDVAGLKRTIRDLEKKTLTLQTVYKEELSRKDQVIENKLTELSAVTKDLADGLETIRELIERQGYGHEVAELSNIRKEFSDGFVNLSKLIEQQAHVQAGSTCVNVVIEPPLETDGIELTEADEVGLIADEYSDVAALGVSIASDVNASIRQLQEANKKTISYYKEKLRDRNQVIEDMKKELESIALKNDQEVSKLKNLLELADRKLDERLEQRKQMEKRANNLEQQMEKITYNVEQQMEKMREMANHVEHITQRIADVKTNESSQKEVVLTVVESMQTTMSTWTEIRQHIEKISSGKAIEEPLVKKSDLPGHLTRLQKLYTQLAEKLSAESVAAELFQNDALSLAQLQRVQFSQTPIDGAEYLLSLLLDASVSYDCFLKALKATKQEHINMWLTYDDFDIDSQHCDLIRGNYTFLLEHLNPKYSGLIDVLFEKEVIDLREKGFLEIDEGGTVCQAERLLSVLSRKSVQQFELVLIALDRTGHELIASKLRLELQPFVESLDSATENVPLDEDLDAELAKVEEALEKRRHGWLFEYVTPTVTHVIAASEDRKGYVTGLTVHGNKLFLVRYRYVGSIEVYNATDFTFQRNITIAGEPDCWVNGLTSCDFHNCLYVGDSNGYIVRVDLAVDNTDVRWKMKDDRQPQSLSIAWRHNLLVTCRELRPLANKLIVYTTHGDFVREIRLQDDVTGPQHAIELCHGDEFIVSHGNEVDELHRVCIVDANGRVLRSVGNKPGSGSGQLYNPKHLAVDFGPLAFVADSSNNRIVVLDETLKWICDWKFDGGDVASSWSFYSKMKKVLQIGDGHVDKRIDHPHSLYFDLKRLLLIISELDHDNDPSKARVVVVKLSTDEQR